MPGSQKDQRNVTLWMTGKFSELGPNSLKRARPCPIPKKKTVSWMGQQMEFLANCGGEGTFSFSFAGLITESADINRHLDRSAEKGFER